MACIGGEMTAQLSRLGSCGSAQSWRSRLRPPAFDDFVVVDAEHMDLSPVGRWRRSPEGGENSDTLNLV